MNKIDKRPRLIGAVSKIEKTGEKVKDNEGFEWEKCVFTLSLKNYSRRTPELELDSRLIGKEVKIIRYCLHDWHYKLGVNKTLLDCKETQEVLSNKLNLTEV